MKNFLNDCFQVIRTITCLIILVHGFVLLQPAYAQESQPINPTNDNLDFEEEDIEIDLEANLDEFEESEDPFLDEDTAEVDTSFTEGDDDFYEIDVDEDVNSPGFFETLLQSARFTLKHEHSYKTKEPTKTVNQRSSVRLEYSKFLGTYFYLQLDTKLNGFHESDHRAKAKEENILFESSTKEAYLQSSIDNTSVKAGLQVIIWGEADGAAVTDVVAPRDQSELFFISLEESRIPQPMIVFDQFSETGDWTLFYIPTAGYTKTPEKDTQYDLGFFDNYTIEDDKDLEENSGEIGIRWKKTFGKSDLAFMAASLIENDYKYELDTFGGFIRKKNRYQMLGLTFNYGKGAFLYKGEIAQKSKKVFNNSQYELIEKDVFDTALSAEYYSSSGYTLLFSMINQRIVGWEDDLSGTDEDSGAYMLSWGDNYLNEDLNATILTSLNYPNDEMMINLNVDYKYYDDLKFEVSFLRLNIDNKESQLWAYRNEERWTFKVQYQF
jgi:hypothetical protein